jgi:hypothetical protein
MTPANFSRSPFTLRNLFVATVAAFALATGCASAAKKPISSRAAKAVPSTVSVSEAEDLERRAKYLDAGLAYAQLANRASAPEKQELQLRSAEVLLRGNFVAQAAQMLGEVDATGLDPGYAERKLLIQARIDLARGNRERAAATLDMLERGAVTTTTRAQVYAVRIQMHTQSGNMIAAARERAKLDPLLTDPDVKRENRAALLQTLIEQPEAALLKSKPAGIDVFGGWIELALILKSARQQPQEFPRLLADWKARYPYHGGADSLAERDVSRPDAIVPGELPSVVALVLPQQGNFAKAADAVRDGFITAYYARAQGQFKPAILFYDSGATAGEIVEVYRRAVRDGAKFVVGPLDKNAVAVLAQQSDLSVPTLALNYYDQNDVPAGLYQFGLSPEDEASQAAERAWLDGHGRAVALIQEGSLGERLLNAFRDRWLQLGGELVDVQTYASKDNDMSAPIKKMFDIDQSEQRRAALKAALGYDIKFSPRRRQDIDMVFVAAMPRHARLIRPQLNFHQAGDIPVYGTSHVFSGVVNARNDHDMDNVTFGDMPWVLPKAKRNTALYSKISQLWPKEVENYMRLYAFGIDAFNLIENLNALTSQRTLQFPGETGGLYVDDHGRVLRRVTWAEFKNGAPRLLQQ